MKIGITERGDAAIHFDQAIQNAQKMNVDGIIFITKNPELFLSRIKKTTINFPFIVHTTITGYGGTKLEPKVLNPQISLQFYKKLIDKYGPNNVVLRVDPIFPTKSGIEFSMNVVKQCEGRLRISFFDFYYHVKRRMILKNINHAPLDEIYKNQLHAPLDLRKKILEDIQSISKNKVEICGEPDLECTGCVSLIDLKAMKLENPEEKKSQQRSFCCCLAMKKELLEYKKPCEHQCIYCYWKEK